MEGEDRFMPFPMILVQKEIQTTLSRIWTQVAESISYNDNSYARCTSLNRNSYLKLFNCLPKKNLISAISSLTRFDNNQPNLVVRQWLSVIHNSTEFFQINFFKCRHLIDISHFIWYVCIYPTPPHKQDVMQSQFLSGVYQVWIHNFPSRLVAIPSLKNPICPSIFPPAMEGE